MLTSLSVTHVTFVELVRTYGSLSLFSSLFSGVQHLSVLQVTSSLLVTDSPVCKVEQKRVYGVAREERANVLCEVNAYPPPEEFQWVFNNSASTQEVSPDRFHSSLPHSLSTLTYTPQNELDFGTVMCWATNKAGRQRDPCVFHIIAAGKPITSNSSGSL